MSVETKVLLGVAETLATTLQNKRKAPTPGDVVKLLRTLKENWPTQQRPNVAPGGVSNPTVQGLVLGLSPNRSGGCAIAQASKSCPELTRILTRWVKATLKDTAFRFGSIQVNYNYAARKHIDSNNLGPSYITSLGDHTGGKLWTADRGELDCYESWKLFDGNTEHMTMPYQGAERFSFILFTPDAYNRLDAKVRDVALNLGFTAASCEGVDDDYFSRYRDLGTVSESAHGTFTEKHHLENPPSFGEGAVSVETNGYAAGRGWGWISWQASGSLASGVQVEHFKKNSVGIHVVHLEVVAGKGLLRKVETDRFNLYQNTAAESQRFLRWVKDLPVGRVVAVCITDTAMAKTRPLPANVYAAFRALGAAPTLTLIGYREPFAFVGFKGAVAGDATYVIDAKKQSKQLLRIDANVVQDTSKGIRLSNVRTSEVKLLAVLLDSAENTAAPTAPPTAAPAAAPSDEAATAPATKRRRNA
jgi:hypothetical protein